MAGLEQYEKFIYEIHTLLKQSELYPKYQKSIADGKGDFKLSQVFTQKNYSNDWIAVLEDCVNALDTIVRNPRKFIVIEEDIVDISLARSISVDSVKHLAQHTNLISSVNKQGMVIPSKILNTSKEESFEIYENRFIYTLLLKTRDFLNIRFDAIKNALIESGELAVGVDLEYLLDGQKVTYRLQSSANIPFDAIVKGKSAGVSDVERLTRIKSIFTDFLSSAFAKEMSTCALVRPPIQRTNVILKDPNFKKALVLWQYIESCEKMDFKVETQTETADMPPSLGERYRSLVFLNTVLMQSIAAERNGAELYSAEEEQKKTVADEYVSKNIDDFVPDDFPFLKMELAEIKRIYYKIPGAKTLQLTEIAKMNAAIDRVIRQYKINKSKADSITRKKLIAQQFKEEELAKKLALREAKAAEKRKKLEEILLKKEEARKLREQRAADAAADAERARLIAEQTAAEEARRIAEERAERERLRLEQWEAEQRALARKRAEEFAEKEEEVLRKQLENELLAEEVRLKTAETQRIFAETEQARRESEQRLARFAESALTELKLKTQQTIAQEREFALRVLTEKVTEPLTAAQQQTLARLITEEAVAEYEIKKLQEEGVVLRARQLQENLKRLEREARTFRTLDDVITIERNIKDGIAPKRRYGISDRLKRRRAVKERKKSDEKNNK